MKDLRSCVQMSMNSDSYLRHPNIATWKLDNFAQICRDNVNFDKWCSDVFAIETLMYGELNFELQLEKKQRYQNCVFLVLHFLKNDRNFKVQMQCEGWIENVNGKRSEIRDINSLFTVKHNNYHLPFSLDEIDILLDGSVVFLCCRFPCPVKSVGSASSNPTLFRWTIDKFRSNYNADTNDIMWNSPLFKINGHEEQEMRLECYVKHSNCEGWCVLWCGLMSSAECSPMWFQAKLWMENANGRLRKTRCNCINTYDRGFYIHYEYEETIVGFAADEPLDVCCEIRPIVPKTQAVTYAAEYQCNFEKFFNNPDFSDAQIEVEDRVFKVSLPVYSFYDQFQISKVIVSINSTVFMEMFSEDSVVKIEGFGAEDIETLLRFMYTGRFEEDDWHFLPIADHFKLNLLVVSLRQFSKFHSVQEKCTESIVANLSMENIVDALELAFRFSHLVKFKNDVLNYGCMNQKRL
ncbi:hypothetical protein M3Y98_00092000 [Aphelenchoides besseyi]|nr:hypothetical protein M3Y98_00092000 [Aphelenchoides besseyi]